MMRSEHHEEDLNVNIVLRSEIAAGDDKGKQIKDSAWVHKVPVKEAEFDLECAGDTFMEAKKNFVQAFTLGSKDMSDQEMDPSMFMTLSRDLHEDVA